jgi:hypothetical protein
MDNGNHETTNQSEIARILQVDKSVICKDIAAIREQAQENLQHHIHEVVPEEYQKCMIGMKRNLKEIRTKTESEAEAIDDDNTNTNTNTNINSNTTNGVF